MKSIKANVLSLAVFVAMVAMSAYFYPQLPAEVATRFDFNGTPLQYTPKQQQVVLMPALFLIMMIVMNALVRISPQKFSMPNSRRALDVMIFATGVLLMFIHLSMLVDPSGTEGLGKFPSVGMAAFLIILGNVFGKTERNFFLGIRGPWTLASLQNWKATHRFAGKLMVGTGVLLLVTTYFYSSLIVAVACLIGTRLVPIFYSYWYYLRNEKNKEPQEIDSSTDDSSD